MGNESVIPPHYLNAVVTGDARVLAEALPANSVDLIFTDPVYDRIEDYEYLAILARRVLKPDKALLCWGAIAHIPQHTNALAKYMAWRWQFVWYQSNNMRFYSPIYNKWQVCYWLDKGKSKPKPIQDLRNVPLSVGNDRQDNYHRWAKHTGIISYYLEAFTQPGDVVLDPFSGGGTVPAVCKMLGRQYVAFEIDAVTADNARQRVLNTQPPLPLVYDNQLELSFDT